MFSIVQKSGFAGHILTAAQRRLDHSVAIRAPGYLYDSAVFQSDRAIFQWRITFATSGIHWHSANFAFVSCHRFLQSGCEWVSAWGYITPDRKIQRQSWVKGGCILFTERMGTISFIRFWSMSRECRWRLDPLFPCLQDPKYRLRARPYLPSATTIDAGTYRPSSSEGRIRWRPRMRPAWSGHRHYLSGTDHGFYPNLTSLASRCLALVYSRWICLF